MNATIRMLAPSALLLLVPTAHAQSVVYEVREIQPPLPGDRTVVTAISDTGCLAGIRTDAFLNPLGFTYDGNSYAALQPILGNHTFPTRVFDNGRVLGMCQISFASSGSKATLWDRNGNAHELRTLPGHTDSIAYDGNSSNTLVGVSSLGGTGERPVQWRHRVLSMLPLPMGKSSGEMRAINDAGMMVGTARSTFSDHTAYLIDTAGAITSVPPPQLNGTRSFFSDVNNAGVAVGFLEINFFAFHGFFYKNGALTQISPVPGAFSSTLFAINRLGQAVGHSSTQTSAWAIVATDATPVNINDVLDPVTGNGWSIQTAYDINNLGQIVGTGTNPAGETVGVLLTPITISPLEQAATPGRPRPMPASTRAYLRSFQGL